MQCPVMIENAQLAKKFKISSSFSHLKHEFNESLCCINDVLVLLLTTFHENHRGMQLWPRAKDHLHSILFLHFLHKWRIVIVGYATRNHDRKLVGDEQRRGETDKRPGFLNTFQRSTQRNLVGFLGGI